MLRIKRFVAWLLESDQIPLATHRIIRIRQAKPIPGWPDYRALRVRLESRTTGLRVTRTYTYTKDEDGPRRRK
jgi:hypothetical protein